MKVIPLAHGRVLEVGIGTGLNMPFYNRERIKTIVAVEPSHRTHHLALKRSRHAGLKVELVGLSAERLPIAAASFETAVSTYTLCTIPDPVAALREMRPPPEPDPAGIADPGFDGLTCSASVTPPKKQIPADASSAAP